MAVRHAVVNATELLLSSASSRIFLAEALWERFSVFRRLTKQLLLLLKQGFALAAEQSALSYRKLHCLPDFVDFPFMTIGVGFLKA